MCPICLFICGIYLHSHEAQTSEPNQRSKPTCYFNLQESVCIPYRLVDKKTGEFLSNQKYSRNMVVFFPWFIFLLCPQHCQWDPECFSPGISYVAHMCQNNWLLLFLIKNNWICAIKKILWLGEFLTATSCILSVLATEHGNDTVHKAQSDRFTGQNECWLSTGAAMVLSTPCCFDMSAAQIYGPMGLWHSISQTWLLGLGHRQLSNSW